MLNNYTKSRLNEYLTKSLGLRYYRRGWLKGDCPSCGRNDKFGVNLYLNRTNCFVCEYHPSPMNLVIDIEGLAGYNEAKAFLKLYEGREYLEPIVERVEGVTISLPESYTNLLFGSGFIPNRARAYIKSRGFDIDEAALKGWGYCTKGEYFGYIILPFYIGGKLVYFNGRRFLGGGSKYKNPSIDECGVGKSLIIYNVDALALYNEVYLVEGVFNADTIGDQGIASGGKKVSYSQISMILKSDVKRVNILLDPDAVHEAVELGLKMVYHKKVRIVIFDGDKDVNDLGKEEALKRVNMVGWMSYKTLLKMKYDERAKSTY